MSERQNKPAILRQHVQSIGQPVREPAGVQKRSLGVLIFETLRGKIAESLDPRSARSKSPGAANTVAR